jgi:uncharacterized radical SAM superfamily protein
VTEHASDRAGRPACAVREVAFFAPAIKHYESSEFPFMSASCGFAAVSVTGADCRLRCDHCSGILLRSMEEARTPAGLLDLAGRSAARGGRGLLVSGGADGDGTVPLAPFTDAIAEIRARHGARIVVHAGPVGRDLAAALARAGADRVMIDVVGSRETLRSVYHLDIDPSAIEESLSVLEGEGVPAAPHVVIGVDRGLIVGERAALEMVARHPPAALVLVVLTPLPGTPFEDVAPPPAAEAARLVVEARRLLPDTRILLGCARPGGAYRAEIDRMAFEAGIDGIAYPHEGAVRLARRAGLSPSFHRECCCLFPHRADAQSGECGTAGA